jgi:hypothetical protein
MHKLAVLQIILSAEVGKENDQAMQWITPNRVPAKAIPSFP